MNDPFADLPTVKRGVAQDPFADLPDAANVAAEKPVEAGTFGDNAEALFFDEAPGFQGYRPELVTQYNALAQDPNSTSADLFAFAQQNGMAGTSAEDHANLQAALDLFVNERNAGKLQVGEGVSSIAHVAPTPVLTEDQQATADDYASNDGTMDHIGDILSRGYNNLLAGIETVNAPLDRIVLNMPWDSEEDRLADQGQGILNSLDRTERANQLAYLGDQGVAGETTFDMVKEDPSLGNVASFLGEQFVGSVPHMGTAMLAMPALAVSQTGNIARDRAANNGTDEVTLKDLALSAPAGVGSSYLERLGLEKVIAPGAKTVVGRIAKAAAGESLTEGAQSLAEYSGGSIGTGEGFDLGTALEQAAIGAGTGGALGGAMRGTYEAPGVAIRGAKAAASANARRGALRDVKNLPAPELDDGRAFTPDGDPFADLPEKAPAAKPANDETPAAAVSPDAAVEGAPLPDQPPVEQGDAPSKPSKMKELGLKLGVLRYKNAAPAAEPAPDPITNLSTDMLGSITSAVYDGMQLPDGSVKVMLLPEEKAALKGLGIELPGDVLSLADEQRLSDERARRQAEAKAAREAAKPEPKPTAPTEPTTTEPAPQAAAAGGLAPVEPTSGLEPPAATSSPAPQRKPNVPRFNPDTPAPKSEATDLRPDPGPVADGEELVQTTAGNYVRTKLEVVELGDLVQAEGANQNRDRSKESTTLQVQDIISNFNPERLASNPVTSDGAPIVGADGAIDSGNGRTLTLSKIYEQYPEQAQAYRDMMARKGFDVSNMKQPILIRRRLTDMTPEQRRQFVIDSNKSTIQSLSAVEQARSDADNITPALLEKYAGGDLNSGANKAFVEGFSKSLTAGEMNGFIGNDRRLTADGQARIEAAIVARAYNAPKTLERMLESSNNDVRAITGSMADVAPAWASMVEAVKAGDLDAQYDVTADLAEAAEKVSKARKDGTTYEDLIAQRDAFDPMSPVTEAFIRAFYNPKTGRAASRKAVTDFLRDYIDEARAQTPVEDMFGGGEAELASPDRLLNDILAQRDGEGDAGLDLDGVDAEASQSGALRPDLTGSLGQTVGDLGEFVPTIFREVSAENALYILPNAMDSRGNPFGKPSFYFATKRELAIGQGANKGVTFEFDATGLGGRFLDEKPASRAIAKDGLAEIEVTESEFELRKRVRTITVADDLPGRSLRKEKLLRLLNGLEHYEGWTKERADGETIWRRPADAEAMTDFDATDAAASRESKGNYEPSFLESSFTNRQSAYDSAIHAIGMDADKFNVLPPARKARLLADALTQLTGIKVEFGRGIAMQFAIDQLLDAHQTLQGMAAILGVSPRALSLDGTLRLELIRDSRRFLGAYSNGEKKIMLPKRSNSFSHEWGHALDYFLLEQLTDADARGLSGEVRQNGADFNPKNVREAFVGLLNAMFFDEAAIAAKIMRLEEQIAKTNSDKQKAALQAQIDNINSGRSRAKERSQYWRGAKRANAKSGPSVDYWTRPTEMLARAFEAYVAFNTANAGFGNEFIGKSNDAYLSDAEQRFRDTYPKGQERAAIFDAFDKLFQHINLDAMVGEQGAAPTIEDVMGLYAVGDKDLKTDVKRSSGKSWNLIKRAWDAEKATWANDMSNRAVDKEEASRRAPDEMSKGARFSNMRATFFSSMADAVLMVAKRWKSKAVRDIHDHFANDLGGERHVGRTFGDAVELRENKALNPIFAELERIGGKGWIYKKLTREQRDTLAKLLTLREGQRPDFDDMGLMKLASLMRKTFNDEWYENHKAGIELGYVKDSGYLNRQIDRELVAGNPEEFGRQAQKVYEVVFDRAVGEDADAVMMTDERLMQFYEIARKSKHPSVKALRDAIKAMVAEEGDADAVRDLVDQMYADVRETFAVNSAFQYREAILFEETFMDRTPTATLPNSEKPRALPAEADELLRDFYNPDPVSSLVNYVVGSVRRTEWERRFGHPPGTKKSGPSLAKQLDERMAKEGVPAEDRRYVWDMVDRMSGRYRRSGILARPEVANAIGLLRVKGTLAMMGRAVTLSFFEPAAMGIATGRPLDGVKAVAKTWVNILHSGKRAEMMEWSRANGFIKHHMLEQARAMDRFQTASDSPVRADKLAASLFRNTGLTFLTAASQSAINDVARKGLVNDMAHRVMEGDTARAREAKRLMREWGVRDPEVFAREIVALNGGLPDQEWLNSEVGSDYITLLKRVERLTIQMPDPAELAKASRNPFASYATYSITAYIQSAYRNLFKRNVKVALRQLKAGEYASLARFTAGSGASVATLYSLQLLASVTREYMFNPERQEEWESEGEWEWLKQHLALAASRTFSFGALDPLISSWKGLRFNRDLAYLPLGAYAGADAQNASNMLKLFQRNSRKTNTSEHNALAAFHAFAIAPAMSAVLNTMPGGPISTPASGAGTSFGTGPIASKAFATMIVGEKHGSIGKDGKKVKSGPTAWDKFLGPADDKDDE